MNAPPAVDGVQQAGGPSGKPAPHARTPREAAVRRWKFLLPVLVGGASMLFVLWCGVLLLLLPDPTGTRQSLVGIGVLTMGIGALGFAALGILGFFRIAEAKVPIPIRQRSLLRLLLVVAPGLLLSGATALLIIREPVLSIDITAPTTAADLVAPLAVTYSVERALQPLQARDLSAVNFLWDIDGDGKVDEETVLPTLTVTYPRDGVYAVTVRIALNNGSTRRATRSLVIRQSVFSVKPMQPLVEQPAVFSIANLVSDPSQISEVQWDFTGDGNPEEVTTDVSVPYIFYVTGDVRVSVVVSLKNNTQAQYERTVTVIVPPPLAFPATLTTEPERLISPPPFGVRFSVESDEDIAQATWDFGDGATAEGMQVAHTYEKKGAFPVSVRARSRSGSLVELATLVRVAETLNLPDLRFEGTPTVQGDSISGEVPLTISLQPKTGAPFVEFFWEAPDASDVGSTEGALQAIYRREGTYMLTLIAQDAEDRAIRRTYTVNVKPRSQEVVFNMRPESGTAPLAVSFDASTSFIPGEDITGYEWTFGDRTPRLTGGARTDHRYQDAGTYVVELTVRTTSGKQYTANRTLVVRPPVLNPCFTPSRRTLPVGGGVQFDATCSTGEWQTLQWDFGDGTTLEELSPTHVYAAPGDYTVTLTATGKDGREIATTATITVTP